MTGYYEPLRGMQQVIMWIIELREPHDALLAGDLRSRRGLAAPHLASR